ncbi:hypothetical protein ANO11243_026900 [Dothideomycetidae sp. 11243]|nr:hypothetical protein ANO11243_026900 [fungal sp. No.11243]
MATSTQRGIIKFDNIVNFRDVGEYTNAVSGASYMKPHMLYRSARPDQASVYDLNTLELSLRIQTILDLRTPYILLIHSPAIPKPLMPPKAQNTPPSPPTPTPHHQQSPPRAST